jgi:hypothetical protein
MKTHLRTLVFSGLLVASLVGCFAGMYLWIDRSITLAYVSQSLESSERSVKNLESLLEREWRGKPKEEIVQKLKRQAAEADGKIVVKQDSEEIIWFDDTPFRFDAGQLKKIGSP